MKIHQIFYAIFETIKSFFTTQILWIQIAHFQAFPLLALKFTKFLMSFLKQNVSFSSKFCVMRANFSVLFIAETLSVIGKRSLIKCKFSRFRLLAWKLTKFLMSFFKSRVSFHLNFASTFTVMTRNSSDIFKLKRVICFGQRETNKVKYFRLLSALMEAHPIPYAIFETLRSGFFQICSNSKFKTVQCRGR